MLNLCVPAHYHHTKTTIMKNEAPTFRVDHAKLLQAVAETSTSDHSHAWHAVASSLLMANMNSLPLDWAARQSAGGANMNFYIVKQLPVLPPLAYLQKPFPTAAPYIALVMPRILELTYTATEMSSYAKDLGYDGPPFAWDDDRRLALRCELDAIHAYPAQTLLGSAFDTLTVQPCQCPQLDNICVEFQLPPKLVVRNTS